MSSTIQYNRRDMARISGYQRIVDEVQNKSLTISQLSMRIKFLTTPTITIYCRHLVKEGYLETYRLQSGYKTMQFRAIRKEYDVSEYSPMELKNGSGVIKSFVMEENLIPQPCGRIISFEKDADMMKMYKEHEQATKSKRYSSNDGFREAAC